MGLRIDPAAETAADSDSSDGAPNPAKSASGDKVVAILFMASIAVTMTAWLALLGSIVWWLLFSP